MGFDPVTVIEHLSLIVSTLIVDLPHLPFAEESVVCDSTRFTRLLHAIR